MVSCQPNEVYDFQLKWIEKRQIKYGPKIWNLNIYYCRIFRSGQINWKDYVNYSGQHILYCLIRNCTFLMNFSAQESVIDMGSIIGNVVGETSNMWSLHCYGHNKMSMHTALTLITYQWKFSIFTRTLHLLSSFSVKDAGSPSPKTLGNFNSHFQCLFLPCLHCNTL